MILNDVLNFVNICCTLFLQLFLFLFLIVFHCYKVLFIVLYTFNSIYNHNCLPGLGNALFECFLKQCSFLRAVVTFIITASRCNFLKLLDHVLEIEDGTSYFYHVELFIFFFIVFFIGHFFLNLNFYNI